MGFMHSLLICGNRVVGVWCGVYVCIIDMWE